MRTPGAFLGDLQILVEGNDSAVRAGINTILGSRAFCRVDNHESVIPLVDRSVRAGRDAGCIITMHTHCGDIGSFEFWNGTANVLVQFVPELSSLWLRFGIRHPVIAAVFVLAGDLAAVTSIAFCCVKNDYFHFMPPFPSSRWRMDHKLGRNHVQVFRNVQGLFHAIHPTDFQELSLFQPGSVCRLVRIH